MSNNQLIADVKAAREALASRGRTTGRLVSRDGRVCALGAVGAGLDGNFARFYLDETRRENGLTEWSWVLSSERAFSVERALRKHLPVDARSLQSFNDAAATTTQDVLNLFDKTIADLGGMA